MRFKTLLFLCICLILGRSLSAQRQQHYYIYIQSEKGQPFYVKHNGKVLSSTERGYIILPELENGTTNITVGFPKEEAHEAQFNLRVAKNDQGYLLKRSGSSSYALYNLQTFKELKPDGGSVAAATEPETATEPAVAAATNVDTATEKGEMMNNLQKDLETAFADKAIVTGPKKPAPKPSSGNSFASALDKVVVTSDDRNIEEVPVAAATEPAKTEEKAESGKKARAPLTDEEKDILRSVLAEESKAAAVSAAEDAVVTPVVEEERPKRNKKHKTKSDEPDFIEFQNDKPAEAPKETPVVTTPVADTDPVEETTTKASRKKKRKLFDDTEHPANIITDPSGYGVSAAAPEEQSSSKKKKKKTEEVAATEEEKKPAVRLVNSDCVNIMDDATFRKLLRKFVAARTDNSMIDVFRKQSRNYCLETAQVKTLGQLLTADDTRYQLLEYGYSKVYDSEKYAALESLLIDDYYKKRFKAMIRR